MAFEQSNFSTLSHTFGRSTFIKERRVRKCVRSTSEERQGWVNYGKAFRYGAHHLPPLTELFACYRAISRRQRILAHTIISYQRLSPTFRNNRFERLLIDVLGVKQSVSMGDIKMCEINSVHEHVVTRQVVRGQVSFLPERTITDVLPSTEANCQ
ncbi:hypothetical protein [Trueperella pyogenes]|uniref:hypothetical protein n=1 Tax=Trueperella pyogenes TaxID=1661 RepID=UPI003F5371CB